MKIIYLSTARIPDEWAHVIQILKMCEAFARAGHTVELVVPRRAATSTEDPFTYAHVERNFVIRKLPCIDLLPGVQSPFFYWLRVFSFMFAARLFLLFHTYDLLYTREPLGATLPKAVLEVHDLTSAVRTGVGRMRRQVLVAITRGLRDDLVALGVPPERIVVAPDGVDLSEFAHPEPQESVRKSLDIPKDAKVALYVGILDAWKGTETVYRAAKLLAPDILTVVVGGFPHELPALRAAHPAVRFLGFRPYRELPNIQQAADVLLLPNSGHTALSSRYTSPLKLFAYMASGKPIVASDLPSLREVLSEENAFLVPPDDPDALARAVRSIWELPDKAQTQARQAQEDVRRYSWQARADAILNTIEKAYA